MSTTDITRLTSLRIQPQLNNGVLQDQNIKGMYAPNYTTAQINTLVATTGDATFGHDALVVYDTDLNVYKGVKNGVVNTFNTSPATATGVGLVTGSPLILPTGPAAAVEVAANEVEAFTYLNTTADTIRSYVNGAWVTVTVA